MRSALLHILAAGVFAVGLAGCAVDAGSDSAVDDVTAAPTLKANVPGFTVWVEEAVRRDHRFGGDVYVVHARTSKNLKSVFSFASDDEFGEADLVSARVFEVTMDEGSFQNLLAGMQLYVQIEVEGDPTYYFTRMLFSTELGAFTGSSKIFVHTQMTPVLIDDAVRFRGVTSVVNGVSGLAVAGPTAPADALVATSARTYAFDFLGEGFMAAAHVDAPVVRFTATAGGATVEKDATIDLGVSALGLIHGGSVYDAFPEAKCSNAVEHCLEALPAGDGDTSGCGDVKQVQVCHQTHPQPPAP